MRFFNCGIFLVYVLTFWSFFLHVVRDMCCVFHLCTPSFSYLGFVLLFMPSFVTLSDARCCSVALFSNAWLGHVCRIHSFDTPFFLSCFCCFESPWVLHRYFGPCPSVALFLFRFFSPSGRLVGQRSLALLCGGCVRAVQSRGRPRGQYLKHSIGLTGSSFQSAHPPPIHSVLSYCNSD